MLILKKIILMKPKRYSLSLIITQQCNLDCTYCYEHRKSDAEMDIEKAKYEISRHLSEGDYDEVEINFFGGEPFIRFDFIKELCEWTWSKDWKKNYIFFVDSNGTLIDENVKQWLTKHKDWICVSLSLDGTRQTHNKNRSNSFDKIDIDFFYKNWPEQPIKMTISQDCINNLAEDVKYIHSLGFEIEGGLAEGIDWSQKDNLKTIQGEFDKLYKFYTDNPDIKPAPILNMAIEMCESKERYDLKKWCGVGEQILTVNTNGDYYPCTLITPMTFKDKDIAFLKELDYSNKEGLIDEECFNDCYIYPICSTCYGANYLANKNIKEKNKSICELTKMRAYYVAALKTENILNYRNDTDEDLHANIRAIKRIREMYISENTTI